MLILNVGLRIKDPSPLLYHLIFIIRLTGGHPTLKIVNIDIDADFELVARYWISHKKHSMLNMFSVTVLWSIWKLKNSNPMHIVPACTHSLKRI
jgi:hypothetical protein